MTSVTYKEIEDIKELRLSQPDKYSNKVEDLIEDSFIGQKQYSKKDDPTKKIKKEDHLQFKKDFKQFKTDTGLEESSKLFYVDAEAYPFLKEELIKRGWKENSDVASKFFDFKYSAAFRNIDVGNLFPGQLVNHTIGSGAFCRKIGLTKYIRGSIWDCGIDADLFYPRSYAMLHNAGVFNFVQDFRGLEAFNKVSKMLQPANRITQYSPDKFAACLELAIWTTCLMARVKSLDSLTADLPDLEINSSLLDILDSCYDREAKNSFLLSKNAVRQSKLSDLGFLPKEDFIKEFLEKNKSTPTDEKIAKLYKDVRYSQVGGRGLGKLCPGGSPSCFQSGRKLVDNQAIGVVARQRHPHIE